MDFSLRVITPAAGEPLTLAQAKSHLKIPADLTDEDADVQLYLSAARDYIEQAYNVRFMPQQIEIIFHFFPKGDRFLLPLTPIQSVDYIHYTGSDLVERSLDPTKDVRLSIHRKPAQIVLPWAQVWPPIILDTADAVRIGVTAGFITGGSPETLPLPFGALAAIRLMITHMYENRSAVTLGTLEKTDPVALGIDHLMGNVRLF